MACASKAILGLVVLGTLNLGCKGGSSSSSSSSSSGGTSVSREIFREYYSQYCAYDDRCASARGGRTFESLAACQALIDAYLALGWVDTSEVSQVVQARACIAGLSNITCDTPEGLGTACQEFFVNASGAAVGGQCGTRFSGDTYVSCRDSNAYCKGDVYDGCGVCAPLEAAGAACRSSYDCANNAVCDGHCLARVVSKRLGEECSSTAACIDPLLCSPASNRCVAPAGEGAACAVSDNDCMSPLTCPGASGTSTCQRPLANGEACPRVTASNTPRVGCAGYACVFSSANAPMGTCQTVPTPLPGDGDPCILAYTSPLCATTAFPDYTSTSCVCRAPKADGVECYSARECVHTCVGGVCAPAANKAHGAACTASEECAAGHCGLEAGATGLMCSVNVCAAPGSACTAVTPSNTTVATAAAMVLGGEQAWEVCSSGTDVNLWWKLEGNFHAGDALRIWNDTFARFLVGVSSYSESVHITVNKGDGAGGVTSIASCYVSDQAPCVAFIQQDTAALWVKYTVTSSVPADVNVAMVGEVIPASANVCSNPPTNTLSTTATALIDGQDAPGRVCSNSAATESWWRLDGPFATGDLLRLDVTVPPGSPTTDFQVLTLSDAGENWLRDCRFPATSTRPPCVAELTSAAPSVWVRSANNPSLGLAQDVTVRLSRTTNPGFTCATTPTNLSVATAVPLTLGQPVTSTVCGAAVSREFYWRVAGPFAAGDLVHLNVENSSEPFGLVFESEDRASYVYCYAPGCTLEMSQAAPALIISTSMNPSAEAESTLTLTASRTTDVGMVCANPPTNQSAATAVEGVLGTPVHGRFCSAAANREFWWKFPGTFVYGDSVRLQVTFTNGLQAKDVDFKMGYVSPGASSLSQVAGCYALAGAAEVCQGNIYTATNAIFVTTSTNPSSEVRDEGFDVTVTRIPAP